MQHVQILLGDIPSESSRGLAARDQLDGLLRGVPAGGKAGKNLQWNGWSMRETNSISFV